MPLFFIGMVSDPDCRTYYQHYILTGLTGIPAKPTLQLGRLQVAFDEILQEYANLP